MRDTDNIWAVQTLGVNLIGLIFYPKSPRYVSSPPLSLPLVARVGVFVNAPLSEIQNTISDYCLDYVQLHGSESVEDCRTAASFRVKVLKAFSVDENFDFETVEPYSEVCDLFVFDTKCSGHGGSGEQFDWSLLGRYHGSTRFLLSGGIGPESVQALKAFHHPQLAGYDLNSRFESSPAMKDTELLTNFLEQLK